MVMFSNYKFAVVHDKHLNLDLGEKNFQELHTFQILSLCQRKLENKEKQK